VDVSCAGTEIVLGTGHVVLRPHINLFIHIHARRVKHGMMRGNMRSKVDWVKDWVRRWIECRYCHRNIYKGEKVWKLVGAPSLYVICKGCGEKFGLKEVGSYVNRRINNT